VELSGCGMSRGVYEIHVDEQPPMFAPGGSSMSVTNLTSLNSSDNHSSTMLHK
jgi:hypothetical protein